MYFEQDGGYVFRNGCGVFSDKSCHIESMDVDAAHWMEAGEACNCVVDPSFYSRTRIAAPVAPIIGGSAASVGSALLLGAMAMLLF